MDLVQRIKLLCDEGNTSFAEVERKVGISNGQIRRWNKSSPKLENVKKVAEHFNVSLDYLAGISEEEWGEIEAKETFEELAHEFELAGFIIHTQFENHLEYVHIEFEYHGTVEKMLFYDFIERGKHTLKELKKKYLENTNDSDIHTIAAHHDGEDWTEEELDEIEQFKEFVRMKRRQQE